jgi:Ca2+/Na+ antiporter
VVALLKDILGEAFHGYDQNNDGTLSRSEFSLFLTDFHENIKPSDLDAVFLQFDQNRDDTIDYKEFIHACYIIIKEAGKRGTSEHEHNESMTSIGDYPVVQNIFSPEGEDDEEEEEVPEDFLNLGPEQQQSAIKRRAFFMLFMGTALVLLFSDPMVDVLSEVAVRLNVPAFYVSFILAPLASNASEVIASQYYAAKKTRKTITISLTALEGAASMNNTFCLSIFMALIYFRGLAWQYSAETISIILVQFGMGVVTLRNKMSTMTAFVVLAVFPLSVLFVALLEYLGMD